MGLHIIGINHTTAPLELREQVAFDPATLPDRLSGLCSLHDVEEALILSTCNRTEIYYYGPQASDDSLLGWMSANSNRSDEVMNCLYALHGDEVVKHLCRVAVGLDSLILGEPQILGQLKAAYRTAINAGAVSRQLHRLLPHAFAAAKLIRTETAIGVAATSAASAAIRLAEEVFGDLTDKHALMIGAGETVEIAASHLNSRNIGTLSIANRSIDRGRKLAEAFNGRAFTLDELDSLLPKADLVFSSTASPEYVVHADQIKRALDARRQQPMFIVDLAVPRDIDPESATYSDVFLYTIDDLRQAVDDNLDARRAAAAKAEQIIEQQSDRYARETEGLNAAPLIQEIHSQTDQIKQEIVQLARKQLAAGRTPEDSLQWLADRLTSRLLHTPSVELRKAAEASEEDTLNIARRLFRHIINEK